MTTPAPVYEGQQVTFLVLGEPIPQGSGRIVTVPGQRYGQIVTDNPRLKAWRKKIAAACAGHLILEKGYPLFGPVQVRAEFRVLAPKDMSRARRLEREPYHLPDLDKYCRALGDALKQGRAFKDDGQITRWAATKVYAIQDDDVGVLITIGPSTRQIPLLAKAGPTNE